jgi:proteasome lid subunit RPN8/RPN11
MTWKDKALSHAKGEDPYESCGLLVVVKGKETYFACKNIAEDPKDMFIIDPEDWAKAEDTGEVTAVIHSHPVTSPELSMADKVACEKTKLKWYVVQPNLEQWVEYEPCGYKAPLIGRKWVWGVNDCWSLCRDYYKEKLNIDLKDWDRPISSEAFILNPMFERSFIATGFRELRPDEELKKNDLLLMSMRSPGLNHIGLYLGDQLLLHHLQNRLSSRDLLDEWLLKCTGKRIRYDFA